MHENNNNTQIGNKSFEMVEQFIYWETTLTNQNFIHEEIKGRLKSGKAFHHSVQNLLSSNLLSKNVKINIDSATIMPVVLYGCETWLLTLREEFRLKMFENRVLNKIFGPKKDEVTGRWKRLHKKEFMLCILEQIQSNRIHYVGINEYRSKRGV
jgi:hypothetical protein